jgi:hypothetical protein
VSLARAYTTGGITQIARSRQPRPAASAFIPTETATQQTFSVRARIARLPCNASAIPSEAKINDPASGMAASKAAIPAERRAEATIRYWASHDTTAAATANKPSATIALRSHPAARSVSVHRWMRFVS